MTTYNNIEDIAELIFQDVSLQELENTFNEVQSDAALISEFCYDVWRDFKKNDSEFCTHFDDTHWESIDLLVTRINSQTYSDGDSIIEIKSLITAHSIFLFVYMLYQLNRSLNEQN